jgi:hypothetical protein
MTSLRTMAFTSALLAGVIAASDLAAQDAQALTSTRGDEVSQTTPVVDVALQEDGIVRGRVVEADGEPLDGSRVVLRQSGRVVAEVITDANGEFTAQGLSSGVYEIETPTASGIYRFWRKGDAPPSASSTALIVSQEPTLRYQFGYGGSNLLALGLGAAGLGVGVFALNEANDAEDRAENAERLARQAMQPASP